MKTRLNLLLGCLLGGAVGDALGLPAEGLSRRRIARLWDGEWHHRLIFGKGMFSDDTEHALMTALSLIEHRADSEAFAGDLARRLRWWFSALPAGTGMATAKSIIRLWFGVSPKFSGVRSAGNGPAMRSAIIGAALAAEPEKRHEYALASCRLTHCDPRADEAALLVADAAAMAVGGLATDEVLSKLANDVVSDEMKARWSHVCDSLKQGASVQEFVTTIDCSNAVSGFAPNTVATVLYTWLRHRGDFRTAMKEALNCGGDVDTIGAILGGIMGAEGGEDCIPVEWLDGICDWPRSLSYLRRVSEGLSTGCVPRLFWPAIPARNLVFLLVALAHGFRRLLPPY